MSEHASPRITVPCTGDSCRICRLIDRDSEIYSEHYRRLFFPEEFPTVAAPPETVAPPVPDVPAVPVTTGPGLLRKAANFGKALVTHVVAGLPEASTDTVQDRLTTCHACEMYDSGSGTCLHAGCGCVVDIKVTWADQRCPIGKW